MLTGRPAVDDPDADAVQHHQVVRRAREAGKFVIQDGSWMGRLAAHAPRDREHLHRAITARREEVWAGDLSSLVVFLLDGDAATSRVWVAMTEHLPRRVLIPRPWIATSAS